jgi:hypothetical protein
VSRRVGQERVSHPVLALAVAVWVMVATPWVGLSQTYAAGTASCSDGGLTNRWLGQKSSTTNQRHGAKAAFEAQTMQLCTNPGLVEISGSLVWADVGPTDGHFNDILQMGAGKQTCPFCPTGMHYYIGMGLDHRTPGCSNFQDASPIIQDVGSWVNSAHYYSVKHVSNVWRFFVDSTQKWVDLAESAVCWTPRQSFWMGETFDFGDQIGGTLANKYSITSAAYMTSEGSNWTAANFDAASPCNYAASNGPFVCDVTGSQTFNIWTDR